MEKFLPNAKILILTDFPSDGDIKNNRLFSGATGVELAQCLREVGLSFSNCSLLSLFSTRPFQGRIDNWCMTKKLAGKDYPYAPIRQGSYLDPARTVHFPELYRKIGESKANLVLALGKLPCWFMLGTGKLSANRGTTVGVTLPSGQVIKTLPTFSPWEVTRDWGLRPIFLADLMKAKREMESPEISREERKVFVPETITEMESFWEAIASAPSLAYDIETGRGQIKCISFAISPWQSYVIPFMKDSDHSSYWPDEASEISAWGFVKRVLELPCPKIAQNGLYDLQWLWRKAAIATKGDLHDTMLLHHALQPELPKSLGFLGSIYCNETSWKNLRNIDTTKRDDE